MELTENPIYTRLCALATDVLDLRAEQVVPEARFADDLGADSLDLVEIVMSCEERFDIEIPNQRTSEFKTVAEAVRFIAGKVAAAAVSTEAVDRPAGLLSAFR